ncbi:MAG TPA: FliM/FliN family flagellar motor C-terminal domain-containing protein [Paucimonas sp.]|nr:FliM/FliN family flagellar motor C-terminal domain-containing protein [Paucimonas sp.]
MLRKRDIDACKSAAQEAILEWESAWARLSDHSISCAAACEATDSAPPYAAWGLRRLENGGSVWVLMPPEVERRIERQLFSIDDVASAAERSRESRLAGAIAKDAVEELVAGIVRRLTGFSSTPADGSSDTPAKCFRYGAGAALLTVKLDRKSFHVLVPSASLPGAAPGGSTTALGPTTGLIEALSGLPVKLTAEVGEAELTVGHLRMLAVGDVVRLNSRLDQPVNFIGPNGKTVCRAQLGTSKGRRAVEVKPLSN